MDSTILSSVLFGYTPLIDRQRNTIGMRLPLVATQGAPMPAVDVLYRAFSSGLEMGVPPVLLAPEGDRLPEAVLSCKADPNVWLEVPAEFASTPEGTKLVAAMMRAGFRMVLRGRPPHPLSPQILPAFKLALIDFSEDRRLKEPAGAPPQGGHARSIPYASGGVRRIADMDASFARGATACVGWPWDDALEQASKKTANPDFTTITELLALIDRGADVGELELVLRRDASLAYRLLRYINSAAFGLRVEITSFRHAMMMLGFQKLKRWLALLLANASKEANLRPVMFASFRRGVFLEHLIGSQDERMRDEVFILGVFSLLDKLFRLPFAQLFETLRVPENVHETLVSRTGPYMPYLRIAENVERGPTPELEDLLVDAVLSQQQCNQALLTTLAMPDLAKLTA